MIEQFREVLSDVWREACRHIEIGQSTCNIAQLLTHHMPLGQIMVRRIDRPHLCLETVSMGIVIPSESAPESIARCSADQMKRLLTWCREKGSAMRAKESGFDGENSIIVPRGVEGDVLVGRLGEKDNPTGILIVASKEGREFSDNHVSMVQILLEPFSIALENDRRLREMEALREAAEADKRSLLNRLGRKELGDVIVGSESGLQSVMERELVSRSDVPVLILGETGTGKELVARAIHTRSDRAAGPFIRVNCGAVPHELIDSQLFGHERGSFTGAVETRKGWFERADGGTLFLDEIGELTLAAQVRLLRVLQEGWLERVGGQNPISVEVRIVCATNRDLAAMVTGGNFRDDLWYRVNVFPILVPPLRERREDVAALARHFAEKAAIRFNLPTLYPTREDVQLLLDYSWPGNVRELGTVLDRAAILGNGRRLEIAKALGVGSSAPMPKSAAQRESSPRGLESNSLLTLDEAIRRHVEAALTATQGRIEGPHGAAARLRINPHTLRARMRKLGINWKAFR